MLKGMLRKLVMEKPRRWHLLISPLMFAIREVPQASTGFSPFEMLYGRNPRGLLDLVKEKWESGKDDANLVIQQVLEMREYLKYVTDMAVKNLRQVQEGQIYRYNKKCPIKRISGRTKSVAPLTSRGQ